jgi:hypothetical protein
VSLEENRPTDRKFGLKRELQKFSREERAHRRAMIADRLGISEGRINQLIYARVGSNVSMKDDQLRIASEVLKCEIEDLLQPTEEIGRIS